MDHTPDTLAEIGRALHGERWQGPLADDLGINRETIRRWLNGMTPLPTDHGMWADLRRVVIEAATLHRVDADRLASIAEHL